MLGEDVTAAGLAPFAVAHRGLVVGADVVRSAGDPHAVRIPKREGVDRACGPVSAGSTMAIAHAGRLAGHGELHGATKAAALIGFLVGHDAPNELLWVGRRRACAGLRIEARLRLDRRTVTRSQRSGPRSAAS